VATKRTFSKLGARATSVVLTACCATSCGQSSGNDVRSDSTHCAGEGPSGGAASGATAGSSATSGGAIGGSATSGATSGGSTEVGGSSSSGGRGGTETQGSAGATLELDGADLLINGTDWLDVADNPILAHEGSVLEVSGSYYWFGTYSNNTKPLSVVVYRSADLRHWELVRDVLTLPADASVSARVARPNVLYNRATGQYVMWFHYDDERRQLAHAALAVSNTVDGEYAFLGDFRPYADEVVLDPGDTSDRPEYGYMSRDCTAFVDDDGAAYFASTAFGDDALNVYRLTDDYLGIDHLAVTLFRGQQRQAPVLFKRDDTYFMLSAESRSHNQTDPAEYASSKDIGRGWSELKPLGDLESSYSLPAFVLRVQGAAGQSSLLYMGDSEPGYVWLPLTFPTGDELGMSFGSALYLDATRGLVASVAADFSLTSDGSGLALDVQAGSSEVGARIVQATRSTTNSQRWAPTYQGAAQYRLTNLHSGRPLGGEYTSDGMLALLQVDDTNLHSKFRLDPRPGGKFVLESVDLRRFVGVADGSSADGALLDLVSMQAQAGSWQIEVAP
jgi:hypothetical protein